MTETLLVLRERLRYCTAAYQRTSRRKRPSREKRQAILERDNYTCRGCGLHSPDKPELLTLHHKRPRACGGNNARKNLVALCSSCHQWLHREVAL